MMLKVSSSATNKKLANSLTYDNDINDEDLEKYILISIAISVFGAMYFGANDVCSSVRQ